MKIAFNSRKWHAWLSFAVSIPILIVAITAIFIAHGQALGFREIKVDASWLPGYPNANVQREVRAVLRTEDTLWIGTQSGLFQKTNAGIQAIAEFNEQEIRALLPTASGALVLTTQGLFAQHEQQWQRVSRAPVTHAYVDNGRVYAVFRGKPLQVSDDGGHSWQPIEDVQEVLAGVPLSKDAAAKMALAKVVKDIHTGEAFLGHDAEWIWNDIVGGAMAFLAITGLYLWWRGQRKLVFSKRVQR